MPRSKRLNIPLPPMRDPVGRAMSTFYRPVPHANAFTDPNKDYDKLRSEARQNRGEESEFESRWRLRFAFLKRAYRRHRRMGSDHETAGYKAALDSVDNPLFT